MELVLPHIMCILISPSKSWGKSAHYTQPNIVISFTWVGLNFLCFRFAQETRTEMALSDP